MLFSCSDVMPSVVSCGPSFSSSVSICASFVDRLRITAPAPIAPATIIAIPTPLLARFPTASITAKIRTMIPITSVIFPSLVLVPALLAEVGTPAPVSSDAA